MRLVTCCHILRTSCTFALVVSIAVGSTGSDGRDCTMDDGSGLAFCFAIGSAHFFADPGPPDPGCDADDPEEATPIDENCDDSRFTARGGGTGVAVVELIGACGSPACSDAA